MMHVRTKLPSRVHVDRAPVEIAQTRFGDFRFPWKATGGALSTRSCMVLTRAIHSAPPPPPSSTLANGHQVSAS